MTVQSCERCTETLLVSDAIKAVSTTVNTYCFLLMPVLKLVGLAMCSLCWSSQDPADLAKMLIMCSARSFDSSIDSQFIPYLHEAIADDKISA